MLYDISQGDLLTILLVVAIIALALFIFKGVR